MYIFGNPSQDICLEWSRRIQGVIEGICVTYIQGIIECMCVVYKNTGCHRRYVCGL